MRGDCLECEVCGAEEAPFITQIEGARLHACRDCARMGKILQAPSPPRPAPSAAPSRPREIEWELVDGFGKLIALTRMRMQLPLAVLAERLAEKESYLERIEHEKVHPPILLVRKIEKELGIQLLEESSSEGSAPTDGPGRGGGTTLGDILQIERRKKE